MDNEGIRILLYRECGCVRLMCQVLEDNKEKLFKNLSALVAYREAQWGADAPLNIKQYPLNCGH